MKKNRFLVSAFLCIVLLTAWCPVYGDEAATEATAAENTIKISTAEDFIELAENCVLDTYSCGLNVILEKDVDLSDKEFSGISWFQGTFDGKGHTISGVYIERDGINSGLFRIIGEGGIVKNLNVEGNVSAGGTAENTGGIVGENQGAVLECSFSGDVKALTCLGGIAGTNGEQGVITSCTFNGNIQGEHQVGGITGKNLGTVALSANEGNVNVEAVSTTSDSDENKLTEIIAGIARVTTEDVLDITDIGGIAGFSSGTVYGCCNTGSVGYKHIGFNVGGICGRTSGYISECTSSGDVYGKNDVGGISGQIEPYAKWDLSDSNLTKLENQFEELENSINTLKSNISGTTSEISGSISSLISSATGTQEAFADVLAQVADETTNAASALKKTIENITEENARDELKSLAEKLMDMAPDTSELTKSVSDTAAAAETLRSTLTGNTGLYDDASAVVDAVNGILDVGLNTASELGISEDYLQDVSVANAYTETRGAVENCQNSTAIHGDSAVGGIAGSMNFEISFDLEDELGISDYLFGNARYEVYSVIRDCSYKGDIEVKKASAGGIVGKESYGLVINSKAVCNIAADAADYIGGIAGYSDATIINSYSRANLTGSSYVGGIAGLGCNISGCVAYSFIENGGQILGGICGSSEGTLENNYYVSEGYGGIDEIDYYGKAEGITFAQMCQMELVPEEFKTIEVTFLKDGEIVSKVPVKYGGSISEVPEVTPEEGRYWVWNEFDGNDIHNSFTVEGSWKNNRVTIATEGDQPEFLAEGNFGENQKLVVNQEDSTEGTVYGITITDFEGEALIRMKGTGVQVFQDGCEIEVSEDGSYSIFTANVPGEIEVKVKTQPKTWIIWVAAGAAAVILILVLVIVKKRKKK